MTPLAQAFAKWTHPGQNGSPSDAELRLLHGHAQDAAIISIDLGAGQAVVEYYINLASAMGSVLQARKSHASDA